MLVVFLAWVMFRLRMATRRSQPGSGTGLNNAALTKVKTIVFRPMPSARVATTAAENQRWEEIIRKANRRSCLIEAGYDVRGQIVPAVLEGWFAFGIWGPG